MGVIYRNGVAYGTNKQIEINKQNIEKLQGDVSDLNAEVKEIDKEAIEDMKETVDEIDKELDSFEDEMKEKISESIKESVKELEIEGSLIKVCDNDYADLELDFMNPYTREQEDGYSYLYVNQAVGKKDQKGLIQFDENEKDFKGQEVLDDNGNTISLREFSTCGEVFNDYNNNQAYGLYSCAQGESLKKWDIYDITDKETAAQAVENQYYIDPDSNKKYILHGTYIFEEIESGATPYCIGTYEGECTAFSRGSHAEGHGSIAEGYYAHSEGEDCAAIGKISHAEGASTEAAGVASHSEGILSEARAEGAHSEGVECIAYSNGSHVEGYQSQSGKKVTYYDLDTSESKLVDLNEMELIFSTADFNVDYSTMMIDTTEEGKYVNGFATEDEAKVSAQLKGKTVSQYYNDLVGRWGNQHDRALLFRAVTCSTTHPSADSPEETWYTWLYDVVLNDMFKLKDIDIYQFTKSYIVQEEKQYITYYYIDISSTMAYKYFMNDNSCYTEDVLNSPNRGAHYFFRIKQKVLETKNSEGVDYDTTTKSADVVETLAYKSGAATQELNIKTIEIQYGKNNIELEQQILKLGANVYGSVTPTSMEITTEEDQVKLKDYCTKLKLQNSKTEEIYSEYSGLAVKFLIYRATVTLDEEGNETYIKGNLITDDEYKLMGIKGKNDPFGEKDDSEYGINKQFYEDDALYSYRTYSFELDFSKLSDIPEYLIVESSFIFNNYAYFGQGIVNGAYKKETQANNFNDPTSYVRVLTYFSYMSKPYAHAEGEQTTAIGRSSHSEGLGTIASGDYQHVSGKYNIEDTDGEYAFIIGNGTDDDNRKNVFAVAWDGNVYVNGAKISGEGISYDGGTTDYGTIDITDGTITLSEAIGKRSGTNNGEIFNDYSGNTASGSFAHAEGHATNAMGEGSHAEGIQTSSFAMGSHSEGYATGANGPYSHTEGAQTSTESEALYAHSEGQSTHSYNIAAHSEGGGTKAFGQCSHAEGVKTTAGREIVSITDKSKMEDAYKVYEFDSKYYYYDFINRTWVESSSSPAFDYSHAEGAETYSIGQYSHTEGSKSIASGQQSHAEGAQTVASGSCSHAEGDETNATGLSSHAEGFSTTASGVQSHAEGIGSQAIGQYAHAEGQSTQAVGTGAHAEGVGTHAGVSISAGTDITTYFVSKETSGITCTPSDENKTITINGTATADCKIEIASADLIKGAKYSISGFSGSSESTYYIYTPYYDTSLFIYSEGKTLTCEKTSDSVSFYIFIPKGTLFNNVTFSFQILYASNFIAGNDGSHAEGWQTYTYGERSHAEGNNTRAAGGYSHSEGISTLSDGNGSHAEGNGSKAEGLYSHAEGNTTFAEGVGSHTEGCNTRATKPHAHAEGYQTTSYGEFSHTEGFRCITGMENDDSKAPPNAQHAEGWGTQAYGRSSHAEGQGTYAYGQSSHAEGSASQALGESSHAEGDSTLAQTKTAHAEGTKSCAYGQSSHAEGYETHSNGYYSHSEGYYTLAGIDGEHTDEDSLPQHAQGKYNVAMSSKTYADVVGGGTSNTVRANIWTLDWDGNVNCGKTDTSGNWTTHGTINGVDVTKAFLNGANTLTIGSTTITEDQLKSLLDLIP